MGRTATATTDMEVTSIRLERDLKDRLKEIAGDRGYQSLVRDVLWQFVQQQTGETPKPTAADIKATFAATARQDEYCTLSGELIHRHEAMLLGLTRDGTLVPLAPAALDALPR